jgi:hypothetical protein
MGMKFRAFSMRDEKKGPPRQIYAGVLGCRPTGEYVRDNVKTYENTWDLYRDVAALADSLGGRLVTITGTPWAEGNNSYQCGEVVVWYRD